MTVAIVTGASRGIGRAIALALADGGTDVAVSLMKRQHRRHGWAERPGSFTDQ